MKWIFIIGVTIIAMIVFFLIYALIFVVIDRVFYAWVNYRHPDYHRILSAPEQAYVEDAQRSLRKFAETENYHAWWHRWLSFSTILVIGGIIFLGSKLVQAFVKYHANTFNHDPSMGILLWASPDPIKFSTFFGILGGAVLAGWVIYLLTTWLRNFTIWLVLKQDAYNTSDPEDILNRRLKQIEHDVRIDRLNHLGKFDPEHFLIGIARRHKNYSLIFSTALLIPWAILVWLEVNSRSFFYYFGVSAAQPYKMSRLDLRYKDVKSVEISCLLSEAGSPLESVHLRLSENVEIPIYVSNKNVREVWEIDKRLRDASVKFETRDRQFELPCIEKSRSGNRVHRQFYYDILHLDELDGLAQ